MKKTQPPNVQFNVKMACFWFSRESIIELGRWGGGGGGGALFLFHSV